MDIEVVVGKKWDKGAVYIGRPSPLGNPFAMHREAEREAVCERYQAWFERCVGEANPRVMGELRRLYALARSQGRLVLGCYCAPRRCHGETIKVFLEKQLNG